MKLKKFNEMYSDKEYDYSKTNEPITLDIVKSHIKDELDNWEIDNPNLENDVDMLAKRIMFSFWDKLNYISENYEGDLENISNGLFE
jgi:DNA-binding protein YbaB